MVYKHPVPAFLCQNNDPLQSEHSDCGGSFLLLRYIVLMYCSPCFSYVNPREKESKGVKGIYAEPL